MRKACIACLILVMPVFLCAQQKLTDVSAIHPIFIRANVFGLIDVLDGNLSGGIEYGIGRRSALTADLGMIFYSVYVNNSSASLGFHFKPSYRYYFTDRRRGYFDAGLFYKRVGYRVTDWLEKDIVNGVAAYEELQKFIYQKNVIGLQIMSGYKAPLDKQGNFWLEFYGGLSVRAKWHQVKNMPDAAYRRGTSLFSEDPTTTTYWPGMPGGMRLVIRVN
jgi:hypothetical protein